MSERPSWMPSDEAIRETCATATWGDRSKISALISTAVEKALAEQRGEWIAALKAASGEYKCHPDFAEMWAKAEANPTYWAELLRSSRDAFREQEARHKREVIEAGLLGQLAAWLAAACKNGAPFGYPAGCECDRCERVAALRAELAALAEVQP